MGDICKLCEAIENGEFYELKEHKGKIDLGIFGQGEATVCVCAHKRGKITFSFDVRGSDEGPFFNVINVPITNCPFCGRKLV